MKTIYQHSLILVLLVSAPLLANSAEVVSENLVFLKEDGSSYLLQRSMRTGNEKYNFHVDKQVGLDDFSYIDPNEYEWDSTSDQTSNLLKFKRGSFTVMYPGDYGGAVSIDADGVYTLNTWDGTVRDNGRFGMWNQPGNFTRFVQAWVIPEVFTILDYESNRAGEWVERNNTLTFFGADVNDLTFTVRYRLLDLDGDGVADKHDRCPDTPAGMTVDAAGCDPDTDGDGVVDSLDQCPGTVAGAAVSVQGCELDDDADGVVNRLDRCAATPADAGVDTSGCEQDTDGDTVIDRLDNCPESVAGAEVDRSGCELDCDEDGVVNSADQCARTPAGASVNAQGCELDTDADGVVDSRDQCPESSSGASVDALGCERDTDRDGVLDSADLCPDTPAGASVNTQGCELDTDADGVLDSRDQCPGTAAGASVDALGCALDTDRDGVLDSADLCVDTPAGASVDGTGCEIAKPITLRGVNFHFNSDQLTRESVEILNGVATTLLSHPDLSLEVAGHTDAAGDDAFNLDLSQRRADAVRAFLVDSGINPEYLQARGYGEQQPIADNATPAGRAVNRRVELLRVGE
jgi:outer membrane protein OmpA-like peptidoglycan-associated protein